MAPKTLDITSNTIRYGECVYHVRNITQINVEIWKRKPKLAWRVVVACAALGLLCFYYPFVPVEIYVLVTERSPWPGLPNLLGTVLVATALYGLWDRTKVKFYTLLVETSGRRATLFSSRDKSVILDAFRKIYEVMENRSTALSYHVNIGDVINTSGIGNKIVSRTAMGDVNNL